MLVLAVLLLRVLPARRPDHTAGYGSLLASVVRLVRDEPVLRARAVCQGAMFGAFTAFWTAIAYELIGEHDFDPDRHRGLRADRCRRRRWRHRWAAGWAIAGTGAAAAG